MIELKIPKLGLTMEEAKLVSWQYRSGDEVKKDDTVFTIETDKVTYEVPAPADGIIHPMAKTGETYPVEETVGYLAESREEYERLITEHPPEAADVEEAVPVEEKPPVADKAQAPPVASSGKRIKASPLARNMAASHGLNLAKLTGTGPGGRIIREDILKALGKREAAVEEEPVTRAAEKGFAGKEARETIPITGIRRAIFDNMFLSLSRTAQLSLHTEACADSLVGLRDRLNKHVGGKEPRFSFNVILVKIAATALRRHPRINASADGDEIKVWKQIHIGVAMESEDALLVPVVRNPDLKSIGEINRELNELITKTRENRLLPDDLANGTFTISNLGFADIDHFTPILKPPESALLGVGRILEKPVVKEGEILSQARLSVSLTFDHRIIDGAPAARFLKTVKDIIEDPLLMIA
ncbi:MAG: 2-oxo acid dehydrogenase subunit E2 [Deltaproteobacteria bacterium]|nr:2-oxo acid dehydrogenase subunit E2 [Deltaproteobacteria bacterium]